MKRTLTSIVAATMVLGTAVPAAFAAAKAPANDISDSPYSSAVSTMVNMSVFPLYADGAFRPTLDVSRGQFVAYLYNILAQQKVITKHYTEKTQPYGDVTADFRNQINDMYLYGFLNNVDLGNGALGQNYKAPKWWVAQVLCNVASISYDSSNPWDALNKARAAGWFANTSDVKVLGDKDTDGSLYYMSRGEMAQVLESFYLAQYPDAFKSVVTSVTASAQSSSASVGATDAISVSATNINGDAVTLSSSNNISYSVLDASYNPTNDATVISTGTGTGNFVATKAGTYNVVATVDGVQSKAATVSVYGAPAAIKLSNVSNLVADGKSQQVTATVVDANGNPVGNYNGKLTLSLSSSSRTGELLFGSTPASTETEVANNGVATFTLAPQSNAVAGDQATISIDDTAGSLPAATASLNFVAPVATSLQLVPSLPGLNADGNSFSNFKVNILDQNGVVLPSSSYAFVTFSIAGAGTFAGGATTSLTEYVSSGVTTVPVYSVRGVPGSVTLTATSTGLATGTASIPTYVETAPGSLKVTLDKSTVGGDGSDKATATVQLLDRNGNLMTDISGNSGATSDQITWVSNNSNVTVGGSVTGSVYLANGQYQLPIQALTTGYTGSASITFTDSNGFKQVVPVTFTSGAVDHLSVTSNGTTVAQSGAVTISAQLVDKANNPVSQAGTKVDFTVDSSDNDGTLVNSYATTNSNGVATVTVNAGSSAGNLVVHANVDGSTTEIGQTGNISVVQPSAYATSVVTASTYGVPTLVTAGQSLNAKAGNTITFEAMNGVFQPQTTDVLKVTTSNPNVISLNGDNTTTSVTLSTYGDSQHFGLPDAVKGMKAGTATITVTDTTAVGQPSKTFTVTVQPSATPAQVQVINPDGTQNAAYSVATAGVTGPFQIVVVDAGGNEVPATSAITLTAADVQSIIGAGTGVRLSPNGADQSSITIGVGQPSVTVYADNVAVGNTSPTAYTIH